MLDYNQDYELVNIIIIIISMYTFVIIICLVNTHIYYLIVNVSYQ